MIETDGIFDWETNGINNGFRYPASNSNNR